MGRSYMAVPHPTFVTMGTVSVGAGHARESADSGRSASVAFTNASLRPTLVYRANDRRPPRETSMTAPVAAKMTFDVVSVRLGARASRARGKQARIAPCNELSGAVRRKDPTE